MWFISERVAKSVRGFTCLVWIMWALHALSKVGGNERLRAAPQILEPVEQWVMSRDDGITSAQEAS